MRFRQAAAAICVFSVGLFFVLVINDASARFRDLGGKFAGGKSVRPSTPSGWAGSVERHTSLLLQEAAVDGWLANYTGGGRPVPLLAADSMPPPPNAVAVAARTLVAAGSTSSMLYVLGVGGAVPEGSVVTGIQLSLSRRAALSGLHDSRLGLVVAGVFQPASNKCPTDPACRWPAGSSRATATLGGAGDVWGLSRSVLSASSVNTHANGSNAAAGFGFAFATTNPLSKPVEALFDAATVTIFYERDPTRTTSGNPGNGGNHAAAAATTLAAATSAGLQATSAASKAGGFVPDHKPGYHLRPDIFWMSDVCGPFVWNGVYHVFYQNTPDRLLGEMCWGHAVSRDLLRWTLLPPIMCPSEWYDIDGVFDGSTFITDSGPMILYCGVYASTDDSPVAPKSMNLAYPANLSDPYLTHWIKAPYNPIVPLPPPELITILDPGEVWRDPDGSWHFTAAAGVLGNATRGTPNLLAVAHFASANLTDPAAWHFRNLFATSAAAKPGWFICAEYFDLDGTGVTSYAPFYQLGTYTPANGSWVSDPSPGALGVYDLGSVICMKSFDDSLAGRRVAIGWIPEADSLDDFSGRGWAGAMTVPRTVTLVGGNLLSAPIPELVQLRRQLNSFGPITLPSGSVYRLPGVSGDQLEMQFSLRNWRLGGSCGVRVRVSTNSHEFTSVFFQGGRRLLWGVDRTFSSESDRVVQAANATYGFKTTQPNSVVGATDPLSVRLLLDHSVLEVYVNDGAYRSALRIYPSRPDSVYIDLYATGASPVFENISVWQMADTWQQDAPSERAVRPSAAGSSSADPAAPPNRAISQRRRMVDAAVQAAAESDATRTAHADQLASGTARPSTARSFAMAAAMSAAAALVALSAWRWRLASSASSSGQRQAACEECRPVPSPAELAQRRASTTSD
eukprot:TRINITY_DN3484_c0_g1_i1.p2 TRINITY_DN3484_c0_g1~~TRINITY_DN3484_c0_g1_i1.p2  ORF type:complete len:907 (-),score=336.39 TRINITY_DN3484_c0_g1_i1:6873-9593(-)